MDMQKGVYIVRFEQWYASLKTCRCCGDKIPEIPLKVRFWHCPEYGLEHDKRHQCHIKYQTAGHSY
ncbi:zinc ribbon domain-containing protein [Photorhabdus akhurstii]|uniref:zinc ribbon domain-containing protein n=1 Tax=Photorhabdus akhurstii TaxID=171438 RepID=UPI000AB47BB0